MAAVQAIGRVGMSRESTVVLYDDNNAYLEFEGGGERSSDL